MQKDKITFDRAFMIPENLKQEIFIVYQFMPRVQITCLECLVSEYMYSLHLVFIYVKLQRIIKCIYIIREINIVREEKKKIHSHNSSQIKTKKKIIKS